MISLNLITTVILTAGSQDKSTNNGGHVVHPSLLSETKSPDHSTTVKLNIMLLLALIVDALKHTKKCFKLVILFIPMSLKCCENIKNISIYNQNNYFWFRITNVR